MVDYKRPNILDGDSFGLQAAHHLRPAGHDEHEASPGGQHAIADQEAEEHLQHVQQSQDAVGSSDGSQMTMLNDFA